MTAAHKPTPKAALALPCWNRVGSCRAQPGKQEVLNTLNGLGATFADGGLILVDHTDSEKLS